MENINSKATAYRNGASDRLDAGKNAADNEVERSVCYKRIIDRHGVVHVMEDKSAYNRYLEQRDRVGY